MDIEVKKQMNELNIKLNEIDTKLNDLDDKIADILILLERDVKPNCNKMNNHIDFIESIYENVKNPLGFLCNKINYVRNDNINYNLENTD